MKKKVDPEDWPVDQALGPEAQGQCGERGDAAAHLPEEALYLLALEVEADEGLRLLATKWGGVVGDGLSNLPDAPEAAKEPEARP